MQTRWEASEFVEVNLASRTTDYGVVRDARLEHQAAVKEDWAVTFAAGG